MNVKRTGILVALWSLWTLAASGESIPSDDIVRNSAKLFHAGRTAEARALLEGQIREMPDDVDAHLAYVELRIALGERERVRREYDDLALKDPSNPAVRLAHLVGLANSREKQAAFQKYLEENPDFARAWEEYGRTMLDAFQMEAARQALEKAVTLAPDRARARLLLGIVYRAMGEREKEEAELREAYELDRTSDQACFELGTTLAYKGDLTGAESLLRSFAAETPGDPDALTILALVEERLGRREESADLRRRVVRADPRYPGKLIYLGNQHAGIQDKELSKRFLELAIFLDSTEAEPYLQLGLIHRLEGNQDQAIRCYTAGTRLRESSQVGWRNLGMAYYDKGDIDSAERSVRRALEEDPDYLQGWIDLARILQERGKYSEAIEAWNRVNSMSPYGWEGKEARRAIPYLEEGKPVPPMERVGWGTPEMEEAVRKMSEERKPAAQPSGPTK
jgi:tetratricopeptide (TPR) repeat protein